MAKRQTKYAREDGRRYYLCSWDEGARRWVFDPHMDVFLTLEQCQDVIGALPAGTPSHLVEVSRSWTGRASPKVGSTT